ncbi:MarR family winged helix-turn-helix transcriptional regulator [Ruminococcus gauvreauii]|uniref:MarR family winged helix-turn-helix transcriptional regulator n=1 Tax=Ruminococcus gauvreauii TaxID=438033 RepID=A0ABY5VM22_9FIRM|nr:MarR family winged helix-turn-helix transcriptional regulator [Ruminococcus gauvreauii]UWP61043.1 MarR family winged helix-turn-helix transcriptional regulator [Ruminococcus gauvreauii]
MKWNIITYANRFKRMYFLAFQPLACKYGLNQLEIDILLFLHNNPDCNTARDIVEKRGFAKSNVSNAVESLRKKVYLVSKPDSESRKVHRLYLLPEVHAQITELAACQETVFAEMMCGFTEEEYNMLCSFMGRIDENVGKLLEKFEQKRG